MGVGWGVLDFTKLMQSHLPTKVEVEVEDELGNYQALVLICKAQRHCNHRCAQKVHQYQHLSSLQNECHTQSNHQVGVEYQKHPSPGTTQFTP